MTCMCRSTPMLIKARSDAIPSAASTTRDDTTRPRNDHHVFYHRSANHGTRCIDSGPLWGWTDLCSGELLVGFLDHKDSSWPNAHDSSSIARLVLGHLQGLRGEQLAQIQHTLTDGNICQIWNSYSSSGQRLAMSLHLRRRVKHSWHSGS